MKLYIRILSHLHLLTRKLLQGPDSDIKLTIPDEDYRGGIGQIKIGQDEAGKL